MQFSIFQFFHFRKRKNIRNHNFIINGIIHHTVTSKSRPVDLAVLDYKQCFDTLAVDVASNDMYNAGVADDNLNLIYECDSLSKIAVKTPVGLTKRVDVEKVVAQGEVSQKLTWRTSTIIKTQYQFLHLEWLTTKSMFLTVDLTVS